jgi:hypothetical protein
MGGLAEVANREAIDALERQPFKARMSQAKSGLNTQRPQSPPRTNRKKASP